jgi:hypothetical protein
MSLFYDGIAIILLCLRLCARNEWRVEMLLNVDIQQDSNHWLIKCKFGVMIVTNC